MKKTRLNRRFFAFFVARRYLFSKKSHNAINIISAVAMCGVAVGTLALVCVLSVLNGFEQVVKSSFSLFDPDLKIVAQKGKTFDISTEQFAQVRTLENVVAFADIIEENALLCYNDKRQPVVVKGVSDDYRRVVEIDSAVFEGKFWSPTDGATMALLGLGVANALGTGVNRVSPLVLYLPKRTGKVNIAAPEKAFKREFLYVSGIFYSGQESIDGKLTFFPQEMVRQMLDYQPNEATSVEIRLHPKANVKRVQKNIEKLLGSDFLVLNREEQQADFYRIMKIEKWISFLILAFILLIAIFNIIGSLSMLMIDKKEDIEIFRRMGTPDATVRRIFLYEGWLISVCGAIFGVVLGVAICFAQQKFGFLKMASGFADQNYPVQVQFFDILVIFATVVILGFLSAYYPVKSLKK